MSPNHNQLDRVNCMIASEFLSTFGDIAEHSPWVAERAMEERPFADREAMIRAFERAVREAAREKQVALIRAHPDLAGKAAIASDITEDSRREQAGAGLDRLTAAEFQRFAMLSRRYREKFGFPFIYAVKGATKQQILEAFERRIGNAPEAEFDTALEQVCRILRFRIEERVTQ